MSLDVIGLFCEDIREEKSGQYTLIGIFPDNLNLGVPPGPTHQAFLSKLGIYVRVHFAAEDDPGPMKVILIFPNGTEAEIGKLDEALIAQSKAQAADSKNPIAGVISHAVHAPFQVQVPGKLLAVLETKTGRHTCAVLNVSAGSA